MPNNNSKDSFPHNGTTVSDLQMFYKDGSGPMPPEEVMETMASFVERYFLNLPPRRIRRRLLPRAARIKVIDTDEVLHTRLPESASPAVKEWLARLQGNIRARQARESDSKGCILNKDDVLKRQSDGPSELDQNSHGSSK